MFNFKKIIIILSAMSFVFIFFILKDVQKVTLKSQIINKEFDGEIDKKIVKKEKDEIKKEDILNDYQVEIKFVFKEYEKIVNKAYLENSEKIILDGDVFLLKEKAMDFVVPTNLKNLHIEMIKLMSNNEKKVGDIKNELNNISNKYPWIKN